MEVVLFGHTRPCMKCFLCHLSLIHLKNIRISQDNQKGDE